MSIELSEINCCKTAGLLRSGVIDDADRILRRAYVKEEEVWVGPGLRLMSPESKSNNVKRKLVCRVSRRPYLVIEV